MKRYGKLIAVQRFNRDSFKTEMVYSGVIYATMERLNYPETFKDMALYETIPTVNKLQAKSDLIELCQRHGTRL